MTNDFALYLTLEAAALRAEAAGKTRCADLIRSQMDAVWLRLTDDELKELDKR